MIWSRRHGTRRRRHGRRRRRYERRSRMTTLAMRRQRRKMMMMIMITIMHPTMAKQRLRRCRVKVSSSSLH
jgi:hypothetical protein